MKYNYSNIIVLLTLLVIMSLTIYCKKKQEKIIFATKDQCKDSEFLNNCKIYVNLI